MKQKLFQKLKKEMLSNESLPLRKGTNNLVIGEGSLNSKVMFIGEGPGFWEDKLGRPFVGAAGKLLDKLLLSINLPREEVFISNVVCYRPPANRDPTPSEIAAFQPYIDRLIEIIKPKVIVTLGRFSMAKFLPGTKISYIHGKPHHVDWKERKITVVPMYHPAAALRNGQVMHQEQADFEKLPEIIKKATKVEVKQMHLM
jgi:DNA polymerase